jgi:hypothetical protein
VVGAVPARLWNRGRLGGLYRAVQARRPALGLLLALTATVAAAGGVLVTVAQFASFLP